MLSTYGAILKRGAHVLGMHINQTCGDHDVRGERHMGNTASFSAVMICDSDETGTWRTRSCARCAIKETYERPSLEKSIVRRASSLPRAFARRAFASASVFSIKLCVLRRPNSSVAVLLFLCTICRSDQNGDMCGAEHRSWHLKRMRKCEHIKCATQRSTGQVQVNKPGAKSSLVTKPVPSAYWLTRLSRWRTRGAPVQLQQN